MREHAAAYLDQLHSSLGVGVPETSGYPALANLLNAVCDSSDVRLPPMSMHGGY